MSSERQLPTQIEVYSPPSGGSVTDAAEVLKKFLEWLVSSKECDPLAVNIIGKRALAAVWATSPAKFNNESAESVADQFGIVDTEFIGQAFEFSRDFKIKNGFQWNVTFTVGDRKNLQTETVPALLVLHLRKGNAITWLMPPASPFRS